MTIPCPKCGEGFQPSEDQINAAVEAAAKEQYEIDHTMTTRGRWDDEALSDGIKNNYRSCAYEVVRAALKAMEDYL